MMKNMGGTGRNGLSNVEYLVENETIFFLQQSIFSLNILLSKISLKCLFCSVFFFLHIILFFIYFYAEIW